MKRVLYHIPELLAPAGDLHTALVALQSGADAVYAGLQQFNARERGANFSSKEMAQLIEIAAAQERRVYVTVNTLLKETELEPAAEMLANLSQLQPDAVIVQDLGVIRMLREYLPDLAIHASTQMGIHNTAGAEMLARLGVKRVILERQLTLSEIKSITRNSPIPTEVFAHGALCCSLSGMCLLSSWMGGWSGNRGKCKQPCRRRYHSPSGNGFFFSTRDLYTLDLLSELCAAGVASLKIEGRLKPPEYVAAAVRAYRLMLDAQDHPDEGRERLGEARRILAGALGRKWSHGFYSLPAGKQVIQHETLGGSGRLVGKVIEIDQDGFSVQCLQTIRRHDRLRVQPPSGEEGPSFTLRELTTRGKRVERLGKGQTGHITFNGKVADSGTVYKTGYEPDTKGPIAAGKATDLPAPICRLNLQITLSAEGLKCRASIPLCQVDWRKHFAVRHARNRPITAADLVAEFSKALPPEVGLKNVTAQTDGDYFVPFKHVRNIRREFWRWFQSEGLAQITASAAAPSFRKLLTACTEAVAHNVSAHTTSILISGADKTSPEAGDEQIIAKPIELVDDSGQEAVLPDFCVESELADLRRQIVRVYQLGCRRFRVTKLFGLQLLADYEGLCITASFPLPLSNSMALKELRDYGVGKATAWVELDRAGLQALASQADGGLEIMRSAHLPLLTTRAEIPVAGKITDSRGGEFYVTRAEGLTRLYSAHPLQLPGIKGVHDYYDKRCPFNRASELQAYSNFNYDRAWQ